MLDAGRCPELEWRFEDADGEIKRIGSVQSNFEAQMEAREKKGRHRANVIEERDPLSGEIRRHVYGGLVCGQVYVGSGDRFGAKAPEIDRRALSAADRARRIDAALELAERLYPGTRETLTLRFRDPMKIVGSDHDRIAVRAVFGLAGGLSGRRELEPTAGVRLNLLRGAGNVAHLTAAAQAAYDDARTRKQTCAEWTDWLGEKLARKGCSAAERALGAMIARQADALVVLAIARFRACLSRVPGRVERGARIRAAALAAAA